MKKYIIPIIIIIAVLLLIAYFFNTSSNNKSDFNVEKMSTEVQNNTPPPQIIEEEISSFSTKIIDEDKERDINMKITCKEINGTVIRDGEEFSFNEVAGSPTPDRGYKKAGIIIDGELTKGYGGGNCQISSTIYNAALEAPDVDITERHEHGVELGYIEMGKDATVAYGDLDLKFKNHTGFDIKLYVTVSDDKVKARIVKLRNV